MIVPSEHDEQVSVVKYCDLKKIPCFATPNGAHLSGNTVARARQMNKLKSEGLKVGTPDLCIPLANKDKHGLFIEMKRIKGGTVSKEQASWIHLLNDNGYKAVVCKGAKEAISVIDEYIKEK